MSGLLVAMAITAFIASIAFSAALKVEAALWTCGSAVVLLVAGGLLA